MGKQFRVRVKAKNAPAKIHKGSSSSSCPSYSKNREIAKAARNALRQRLVAIDDRIRPRRMSTDSALTKPLEDMDMSIEKKKEKKLKKAQSVQSLEPVKEKDVSFKLI